MDNLFRGFIKNLDYRFVHKMHLTLYIGVKLPCVIANEGTRLLIFRVNFTPIAREPLS